MTFVELLRLMRKHLAALILVPIGLAAIVAAASILLLPDTYTARTSLYVLVKNERDIEQPYPSLSTDLSAGQMITSDVVKLINSDRVKNDTAEDLGLETLDDYAIGVESESNTRVITVSVIGTDPEEAASVANGLAGNASLVAQEVMDVESVNVIDPASAPEEPSGPSRVLYTFAAWVAGILLVVTAFVLADMLNTKIRGADDLEELLDVPVIGRVPAMKKGVV